MKLMTVVQCGGHRVCENTLNLCEVMQMGRIGVKTGIANFPRPSFNRTIEQLDAWEVVGFVLARNALVVHRFSIATEGGCRYVDSLQLRIQIDVTYHIARELQDRIRNTSDPLLRTKHRQILDRVKSHAGRHYSRVRNNVLADWADAAERHIDGELPTRRHSTSTPERGIRDAVEELRVHWQNDLIARMRNDVREWDSADYPQIERFLRSIHASGTLPRPSTPRGVIQLPPSITFGPCAS